MTKTVDTAALIAEAEAKATRKAELAAKREAAREAIAGESKADAFKRIAGRRVNNTLDQMATLENVFDSNNYDFNTEQADKVVAALEAGIAKIKARAAGQGKTKSGFEL